MAQPSTSHAARILRAAMSYASLGWHLIPTHGITPDRSCTCSKPHPGSSERSKGKHPILTDWGSKATTDEEQLAEWFDRWPMANLGMVLGPMSGIVDIEYDSEEGRATADRMLGSLVTPTYRSGRSVHRLVRWTEHLPDVQKIEGPIVGGLEIRVGGGGRQTMSVVPPSRYWSGGEYEWLPGLSPEECDVAQFPDQLLARIVNGESEPERPSFVLPNGATRARQLLVLEQVPEGERNSTLHAFACREAVRSPDITQPREEADLREKVAMANLAKCRPPLPDEEVDAIVASAIKWVRAQPNTPTHAVINSGAATQSDQDNTPSESVNGTHQDGLNGSEVNARNGSGLAPTVESGLEDAQRASVIPDANQAARIATRSGGQGWISHGLKPAHGQWTPGEWQLTVILGDPPTYRLTVPEWADLIGDGLGQVTMSVDEFMDSGKMARSVLVATKTVILEVKPRIWAGMWVGTKDQEGLRSQLMASATTEAPAVTDLSYYATAEWLLEKLEGAEITDGETISEDGTQVQRLRSVDEQGQERDEWVIRWTQFWRRPIEQGVVTADGTKTLAKRMGWGAGRYSLRRDASGSRRRVLVLHTKDLGTLRKMVEGSENG